MRPHPSTCATIPQWPGCRSALRPNLSSTSGGHRRGPFGHGLPKPAPAAIHVLSLPQTGVSLFGCRYPCVKGALTLDAAILLGAGADALRRWRLVVIMIHALRDVKRQMR